MRIVYGDHSYVDTFMGWNVATRTDKPPTPGQTKAPAPSYTWSDDMTAKFQPNSSSIDHIEQRGNFRYKEAVIGKLPPTRLFSNKRLTALRLLTVPKYPTTPDKPRAI